MKLIQIEKIRMDFNILFFYISHPLRMNLNKEQLIKMVFQAKNSQIEHL